jgi:hypothetical protein
LYDGNIGSYRGECNGIVVSSYSEDAQTPKVYLSP